MIHIYSDREKISASIETIFNVIYMAFNGLIGQKSVFGLSESDLDFFRR